MKLKLQFEEHETYGKRDIFTQVTQKLRCLKENIEYNEERNRTL